MGPYLQRSLNALRALNAEVITEGTQHKSKPWQLLLPGCDDTRMMNLLPFGSQLLCEWDREENRARKGKGGEWRQEPGKGFPMGQSVPSFSSKQSRPRLSQPP